MAEAYLPSIIASDDQALEHIMQQPRLETSVSELARTWGWNRTRVRRRLRQWMQEGKIAREITPDGRSTITVNALTQVNNLNVEMPALQGQFVFVPRINLYAILALIMGALAVAVAWYGLQINAWYGASLGRDAAAAALLSGLSVVGDAVALFLPAIARAMWLSGNRHESVVAWALWVVTMGVALLAAIGFASLNIADTTAARSKYATEATLLAQQIARLEAERAGLHETRTAAAIEAELQAAQPAAAPVWSATAGCTDVTRARSGELCAPILKLRQAQGEAQRRERIDVQLALNQAKLATLPAVSLADPQAEMAANLLRWATGGLVAASAADINMARIVGMTLLPQISGLVLMLAAGLWRVGRKG